MIKNKGWLKNFNSAVIWSSISSLKLSSSSRQKWISAFIAWLFAMASYFFNKLALFEILYQSWADLIVLSGCLQNNTRKNLVFERTLTTLNIFFFSNLPKSVQNDFNKRQSSWSCNLAAHYILLETRRIKKHHSKQATWIERYEIRNAFNSHTSLTEYGAHISNATFHFLWRTRNQSHLKMTGPRPKCMNLMSFTLVKPFW